MAANESRRRVDPTASQATDPSPASKAFQYQPLDENVDCTRFVVINPAENDDDPISCHLVHLAFGTRPKFDALSYTWGDENPKEAIQVDGCAFEARKNLFDALRYLRRHMVEGELFWIDALCIDQDNIAERNRQLRMMGHIYFRAQKVIVWLGRKYAKYESDVEPSWPRELPDSGTNVEESKTQRAKSERDMVKELVNDEYWNRLWIIQELGQNEQKKICFGNMATTWEAFIQFITTNSSVSSTQGPLRLDRHLKEKYQGSHTLRRLLLDHKDAQCKERKDKVYGLVGLAADARGFPMDYEKSPMDIWMDTMEFLNRRRLFADIETEIVEMGALVKFLLMDPDSSSLQQIWRSYKPKADPKLIRETQQGISMNSKVFHIQAYALGTIDFIGPATQEIVSTIGRTDDWADHLQRTYREDIGAAYEESNRLLKAILSRDDEILAALCLSHVGLVRWHEKPFKRKGQRYGDPDPFPPEHVEGDPRAEPQLAGCNHTSGPGSLQFGQARTYQLLRDCSAHGITTPWKMGLVSAEALPGDMVCWIRGTRRTVLVRIFKVPESSFNVAYQICGAGVVSDDITGHGGDHNSRCNLLANITTTLKLDARTLYLLLP
ncbi:Heterokaryon incompatibility protein 6, OR allele [Colletotrichum spinosum]|uniref:Heterokaryon incompatibility protein 6, OR allele n=1 Tax=Colletotrichum spinosum TaxID=1347390 RepID=A0A4R8QNQ3_9PEZI|nr:Heterokaryon incompatibility protein 6, OR allele [Colletotrichum spinosum]